MICHVSTQFLILSYGLIVLACQCNWESYSREISLQGKALYHLHICQSTLHSAIQQNKTKQKVNNFQNNSSHRFRFERFLFQNIINIFKIMKYFLTRGELNTRHNIAHKEIIRNGFTRNLIPRNALTILNMYLAFYVGNTMSVTFIWCIRHQKTNSKKSEFEKDKIIHSAINDEFEHAA